MRGTVLPLALVLALPALASASQIPIGLNIGQNVFVQEFWQNGKAHYAIYNSRPAAIKLTVNDVMFVAMPGTESFRNVEGKNLATWDIKSKEVVFVDAPVGGPPAAGDDLRFFRFRIVGGPTLGLLTIPSPSNT